MSCKKLASYKNCFTTKFFKCICHKRNTLLDESWDKKSHCWDWNGNVESQYWQKKWYKRNPFLNKTWDKKIPSLRLQWEC